MASLYVKYPKICRNKKSSVFTTPPVSSISSLSSSSSSGSLSSSRDGIKSSLANSPKRKHHYHYSVRSHKVSTMPKRKKLKLKKSKASSVTTTSSDSDTNKYHECRSFINNNAQDEINRNAVSSTCKTITLFILLHYFLFSSILIVSSHSHLLCFRYLYENFFIYIYFVFSDSE